MEARKCVSCGADYEEDEGDDGNGEIGPGGGKKVHATGAAALALIDQGRRAGTL